jgi:hypothetical protein
VTTIEQAPDTIPAGTIHIFADVLEEGRNALAKHGPQNHPDGTGPDGVLLGRKLSEYAEIVRNATNRAFYEGELTWLHILAEEFFEAAEERNPVKLRAELIQVMSVATHWIEQLDREAVAAG